MQNEHDKPESSTAIGGRLERLVMRIYDAIFPYCPRGGHRQKMSLVTNVNGNQYCWHPDCIRANFKDVRGDNVCKQRQHTVEHDRPER